MKVLNKIKDSEFLSVSRVFFFFFFILVYPDTGTNSIGIRIQNNKLVKYGSNLDPDPLH